MILKGFFPLTQSQATIVLLLRGTKVLFECFRLSIYSFSVMETSNE